MIPLILLGLVLLAITVWILLPLRRPPEHAPETGGERAELEARHRHLLFSLQDLDFELETGKLSREDHAAMRRRVEAEAVAVLRRLDEQPSPDPGGDG